MMAELTNLAEYSKMSILNLFSPKLNHKNRRKPAPRLASSPFVHYFNAQQMLTMLKFSSEILETKTSTFCPLPSGAINESKRDGDRF